MLKKSFFLLAAALVFAPAILEAEQAKNLRLIPGGAASGQGQIRIINLGGALMGRSAAKRRPAPENKGRRVAVAAKPAAQEAAPSALEISAEFRLREVYVFPNPAKGGKVPSFHVETGIADSVKITVYNVAGEEVHQRVLTGVPGVIDDGNGLDYAYEYAWQGHIASGVYYYLIEAEKAGKKLRTKGKFAVVR